MKTDTSFFGVVYTQTKNEKENWREIRHPEKTVCWHNQWCPGGVLPPNSVIWIDVSYVFASCMGLCIQYWSYWFLLSWCILLATPTALEVCSPFMGHSQGLIETVPVYTWQGWQCVYEGSPILRGSTGCPGDSPLYRYLHKRWPLGFLISWDISESWGIAYKCYILGGLVLFLGKVPVTACIL